MATKAERNSKSNEIALNHGLIDFLCESPSPFHAVSTMAIRLEKGGYERLSESRVWELQSGKSYYLTRNDSSLIAFSLPKGPIEKSGFRIVGAHTDSPCLKLKPNPVVEKFSFVQLGVEIYGGMLLAPWFDRDLSIAGRVSYLGKKEALKSCLVDFCRPIATVPNLAIHLNRSANDNRTINRQDEMPPILLQSKPSQVAGLFDFQKVLLAEVKKRHKEAQSILDFELCLYDTQRPAIIGLEDQFLAGARLDNLLSCFVGLESLLACSSSEIPMLVCNDHEEVGSQSSPGAAGPFLESVLQRIAGSHYHPMMARSMLISCDNSHGIHPNYPDRHDPNHAPKLNLGPAIKINANQRYATSSETAAVFSNICEKNRIPYQRFVSRSNLACGSTIGPITATAIGIKTLDVGVPTFAMHSIRELAGTKDAFYLYKALKEFYREKLMG